MYTGALRLRESTYTSKYMYMYSYSRSRDRSEPAAEYQRIFDGSDLSVESGRLTAQPAPTAQQTWDPNGLFDVPSL